MRWGKVRWRPWVWQVHLSSIFLYISRFITIFQEDLNLWPSCVSHFTAQNLHFTDWLEGEVFNPFFGLNKIMAHCLSFWLTPQKIKSDFNLAERKPHHWGTKETIYMYFSFKCFHGTFCDVKKSKWWRIRNACPNCISILSFNHVWFICKESLQFCQTDRKPIQLNEKLWIILVNELTRADSCTVISPLNPNHHNDNNSSKRPPIKYHWQTQLNLQAGKR